MVSVSDIQRPSVFSIGGASSSPMNEDDPTLQLSPSTGPFVRPPGGSMSYDVLPPASGSYTGNAPPSNPFEQPKDFMCLVGRIVCEAAAHPPTPTVDPLLTPNTSSPLSQKTTMFDGGDEEVLPQTLNVDQQYNNNSNETPNPKRDLEDDEDNDPPGASQLIAISSSRGKRSGVMSLSTDGSLHAPPSNRSNSDGGGINSSDDDDDDDEVGGGGKEPPVSSRFASSMSTPPQNENGGT